DRYIRDYNIKEADIIGRHHYDVFPELPQKWKDVHQRCLAGAVEGSEDDYFIRPDGSVTYTRWECRPWHKMNGEIGGLIIYTEVVTERRKAEKKLHESELRYRAFFENSMDAILLTNPDGTILSANQAACSMFGYSEQELIQLGRTSVEDPSDPRLDILLAERKRKGKAKGIMNFIRKDGSRFPAEIATSVFNNDEGLERASWIIRDITEQKKIQKELKFQANLLSNVGQSVIATDASNLITYWNKAAEQMYGWSAEEVLGKNILDLVPIEFTLEKSMEVTEKISRGEIWTDEFMAQRKDGSRFPVFISNSPFFDESGALAGIIGISKDITERKEAEESLLKLSSAIEQSIDSVVITDRNGVIEYANPAYELMTGYSLEEALGHTPRIIKSGLHDQKFYQSLWQTILSGQVFREEVVNRKKNGELFYEQKTISPIFDKNGNITHFIGTGVDISERKRTEQALLESDKLYHSLFENMLNAFSFCKMIYKEGKPYDFTYLGVNKSFEKLTGKKDVIGKNVTEIMPGVREKDPDFLELFGRVALTGVPEMTEMYLESVKAWSSISVYSPQKDYFVAIFDVITSRKNAEEVLRQSEAKFRKLINSLPDSVLVVDPLGRIVFSNDIALQTFQFAGDEMLGLTIESLVPNRFRQHHVGYRNDYLKQPESRPVGVGNEIFALRRDESEFPAEIMLEPIDINNNPFILTIVRDITERKMAEKELIMSKEKAEESDRLKSAFLANMSHEVRTPLNSIIGFSQLLSDPFFEEEQKIEFIHHIVLNGNNLLTIISDIMDISKIESGQIPIRINKIHCHEFITQIKDQYLMQARDKNLELCLTPTEIQEEAVVLADSDRLMQVFNNLIGNALKFTPKGRIEIGYQPYGSITEFYVKDTGIGIAEEFQVKIFDSFRQVEDANTRTYGGNGLGLTISKKLVELMGGKIWVESELGKGSTFYFTLPGEDNKSK
ncbi:MAG TPA: PAS domain S-box protein, partial [Prolixibacteraceae bacterium]|nr:PAS domain S-box protein [Prolixibacteraceae bacterium]